MLGLVPHITIDRRCIRPVGLDGNDREAVFLDQAPRDRGARTVKFRGAMARLAEQHDARMREPVEQAAERWIVELRQALGGLAQQLRGILAGWPRLPADPASAVVFVYPLRWPALLPDERHEPHGAQIFLTIGSLSITHYLHQMLFVAL